MIPNHIIEKWRSSYSWQTPEQAEQDLIISRGLIEFYNNEFIAKRFAFRGGTALNKLFIDQPIRYSEDIDLVQLAPIEDNKLAKLIFDTVRSSLAHWLGKPKERHTDRCKKIKYGYKTIADQAGSLKLEINNTEYFHVLPLQQKILSIQSEWFSGSSSIQTYALIELMATKLCALYQRKKGRDLFDVWYVLNRCPIDFNCQELIEIFIRYCAHNKIKITAGMFKASLKKKMSDINFIHDMDGLLPLNCNEIWKPFEACRWLEDELLSKIPSC